ncbi:2-oxoacid:acceptor oxidoreductase family protein, partial [Candidatus Woesebacteria bacterium]|nr:2-oxoacid:acceptor oxidoreductase family protein [Candidatus Woesebacteria bacterium]
MAAHSNSYSWKIGAPAGFGVMTVGMLMAKLAARNGLTVAGYPEYPSLIQGGHNTFEITASPSADTETVATKRAVDCLVCLTADTLSLHANRLSSDSLVVYDPAVFQPDSQITNAQLVAVPLSELQASLKADKIMINTIAFGASAALFGSKLDVVLELITDQFAGKKSTEIAEINQKCVTAGYEYIVEHFPQLQRTLGANTASKKMVITGNDAFALAAIAADCRLYVSYPMTPTSAVLEVLTAFQENSGMVVKTAEDEIAVTGIALGASFAGARTGVGTSGGGFALMVEHISYAGIAEIPLVILLGQRPGPATGMPTWTEQGDLLFAVHAGHGEFPKIVLAAGDLEEMARLTVEAFDLADRYQTPVILMSDKYLAESQRSMPMSVMQELQATKADRGKLLLEYADTADKKYERYADTTDGVSPRLLPGVAGQYYQANSYEHLPDSHTSEDGAVRIQQV